MYSYNPDTGQYEPLNFSEYLTELKRRVEIIKSTKSVKEAFIAGGDFQDMAEANKRKHTQCVTQNEGAQEEACHQR